MALFRSGPATRDLRGFLQLLDQRGQLKRITAAEVVVMVAEPDQPLPMTGRAQTGFRIVTPLLPEGQGCCGLVVGDRHRFIQFLQPRRQSSGGQGIFKGIGPFPAAAHNRQGFG